MNDNHVYDCALESKRMVEDKFYNIIMKHVIIQGDGKSCMRYFRKRKRTLVKKLRMLEMIEAILQLVMRSLVTVIDNDSQELKLSVTNESTDGGQE